jgi:hypothetical protein
LNSAHGAKYVQADSKDYVENQSPLSLPAWALYSSRIKLGKGYKPPVYPL